MRGLDDADLAALRELAATVAAEQATGDRIRAAGSEPDPALEAELVATGLRGLEVPEEYGGAGAGFGALLVALEELGARAAVTHLFTSAVLGAGAVLLGGSPAQRERWLPGLAGGTTHGTAALTEWFDKERLDVEATPAGGGWTLDGTAHHVLNARVSDLLVVPAVAGGEPLVAVVPRTAAGVAVTPLAMTDATRAVDHVTVAGVPVPDADILAIGADARRLLAALADRAAVAVTADSVGNARRVLDLTVGYVREREQFGRPVGSFQAVKHQAADMHVNVETMSVLYADAARLVAEDAGSAAAAVSMAKEYACERAAANAGVALQLHGGIGYTWEHDLHIYLKRAVLNEFLFGDGRWHRRRVARKLAFPYHHAESGERNQGASAITTRRSSSHGGPPHP